MFMCCRFGQKDPRTTEQAIFACLICDCDLQSVKALRAHIKGGKHIRGERNKMKVRLDGAMNCECCPGHYLSTSVY